jgi:hypothetical protein
MLMPILMGSCAMAGAAKSAAASASNDVRFMGVSSD